MEIKIFENAEFGSVRTVDVDGVIHFVGKDVADILGYGNSRDALAKHVDEDDKADVAIHDGRQNRNMTVITESGLYSLVLSSKLPTAKKFKHWVTSEILPSIRKHGAYMTAETLEKALYNPDFLIRLATELKDTQEHVRHLEAKIDNDQPKVIFADAVSVSNTSILVGDLAKIIKQNGVEIGANRLFKWLRDNGYLISRKGSDYNSPTQKSMDLKLFEVKETVVTHSDGHTSINKTPKVTGKGQQYFVNKFITALHSA